MIYYQFQNYVNLELNLCILNFEAFNKVLNFPAFWEICFI